MARITLSVLAGLLALAMATPSSAADLPRKAPVYTTPVFSWSGVYVGINGGYGWGTSDWSSAATAGSPKPKGGLVGGTLGYNVQTGGLVWGLEGDLDYSWIKGTDTGGTGVCAAPGCETRNTYLATGRGRIGFAADRWLPYLTGGAALGGLKMSPNNGLSQTKSKFGWTLGGGVEYAVTGAWSVKAEYLYVDLGRTTCSAATCGIDTDVKFKENIVRTGLNYRF
ncbi:MAG: outer membrane protein [Hyphomicrobiales bacterium]